jgi:aspartate/methionine/tyrosine aminotransferase
VAEPLMTSLHPSAAHLPESGILKVFNYGRNREGLIPLWAGEGDVATPAFICESAYRSMMRGETFYTANRGIPELRQALARYYARLYGMPFAPDEFCVTGGGMQAIQLTMQALVGEGDEVIIPEPAWPNFAGAVMIQGGRVVPVAMRFTPEGWTLPLDALFAAVGPRTRAIIVNSPANPTGWTATRAELKAILEFARKRGIWIVADEIYARFHFAGGLAPSFLEWRQPDDRIVFVNTFSKMWAMTGWRIGWLQAPPALGQVFENLVQYNTSGVAPFMQRAGIAALEDGEGFAREQIARAAAGREIVAAALQGSNKVRYASPAGAFYAFFGIDGLSDSMAASLRLIDEAGVGLAPGIAFGPEGEGYFRICFLRSPDQLGESMQRLMAWLRRSMEGAAAAPKP